MKIDEVAPVNSYLLALVGQSGQVIDQFEGNSFGHIVITQPPMKWETSYKDGKTIRQVPTIMAVESTGGVGLCEHIAVFERQGRDLHRPKRMSHPEQGPSRFRVYRVL